jgi:sRNA-binding carbon storage regulator CsrA
MDKQDAVSDRSTLCITRQSGQAVWIGDTRVQLILMDRGNIKVRINAPRDVPIRREELKPPTTT